MYMRIDKAKIKRQMEEANIATFNELGEKTTPHGLGVRKMYDLLDGYDWNTQQLYALCNALGCTVTDILSFDLERIAPKAGAPSAISDMHLSVVAPGM